MPIKRFALTPGEPERLELRWQPVWKNMEVRLDNKLIGEFERMEDLQKGREFALPDGARLTVQLELRLPTNTPYLHVLRNGRPLAGSDTDPRKQFRESCTAIIGLGALFLVGGAISFLGVSDLPQAIGLGPISAALGAVLLGAGIWALTGASRIAIIVALIAALLEAGMYFAMPPSASGNVGILSMLLRVGLVIAPIAALKELRQAES